MWEEFLQDSSRRREAQEAFSRSSSVPTGSGSSSKSRSTFLGTMKSIGGRGLFSGKGTVSKYNKTFTEISGDDGYRREQAPTLLDELEWTDLDMRRSHREKFEILFDRYEM
jgi:hypothetical protein